MKNLMENLKRPITSSGCRGAAGPVGTPCDAPHSTSASVRGRVLSVFISGITARDVLTAGESDSDPAWLVNQQIRPARNVLTCFDS